MGHNVLGIDSSSYMSEIANKLGIKTYCGIFDYDLSKLIKSCSRNSFGSLSLVKNKSYKSVVGEYLIRNNFPIDINKKIGFQANRNLTWDI